MRLEYPLEIIDALRHISQIELLFRREQLQPRKKKMTPANSFSIKRQATTRRNRPFTHRSILIVYINYVFSRPMKAEVIIL